MGIVFSIILGLVALAGLAWLIWRAACTGGT